MYLPAIPQQLDVFGMVINTVIVIAVAFAALAAVASYVRYQGLALRAGRRSVEESDFEDAWPVMVSGYLGGMQRQPEPFTVITLSTPGLEDIGAKYGEAVRGELLDYVSREIINYFRAEKEPEREFEVEPEAPPPDTVVRYTENQIGIVLGVDRLQARRILDRVVQVMVRESFRGSTGVLLKPPLHIGAASYPENGEAATVLIKAAEEALDQTWDDRDLAHESRVTFAPLPEGESEPVDEGEGESEVIVRPAGVVDELTGVLRADKLGPALQKYVARHRKYDEDVAFLYIDVDSLDQYNRHYGRAAGDEILRTVGRILEKSVREDDLIGRVENDEFMVAMGCSGRNALEAAKRISNEIKTAHVSHENSGLRVTVCIGIAAYPDDGVVAKQLFMRSETALKGAKRRGRNMCMRFAPIMERRRAKKVVPKETF